MERIIIKKMKLDTQYLVDVNLDQIRQQYSQNFQKIFHNLHTKQGVGSKDWTGWINWVHSDHEAMIKKMETIRDQWIAAGVTTVVVIGIGGSYIGAKAGIEYVLGTQGLDQKLNVVFVASFSDYVLGDLLKKLQNKKFALLVVSKSGTTLEIAVSFRLLRNLLFQKFQHEVNDLIAVVTDQNRGILKQLAKKNQLPNFVIEDDIGGRFSSLTAVGLFPSILAGIDARQYLKGAQQAYVDCYHDQLNNNVAAQYACLRHYFYTQKKLKIECLCNYDPQINFLLEQAKQLFAESEGKNGLGLMPIILNFTTDLHSVGQLIQDGDVTFFETNFLVKQPKYNLVLNRSQFGDDDQLDWLANKSINDINHAAFTGTVQAHSLEAKVNNLVFEIPDWSAFSFGYLYYFFCLTTVYSAYLLELNPFDQPGVENYKKRMFSLLKS